MAEDRSSNECCSLPGPQPTSHPLPNVGSVISLDNLKIYVTGPPLASSTSTKALICIYDIFGAHASTHHGADLLANLTGFTILVPDIFLGGGWSPDNMPPREGREAMQAHIHSIGSWAIIKPFLLSSVNYLKTQDVDTIGIYGFCFGGKKIVEIMKDEDTNDLFKAAALIHPTNLAPEDGELFDIPVALIPSSGEDGKVMNAIWTSLQQKSFGEKCRRKDFLVDKHGFASARAEWNDSEKVVRVKEVYTTLSAFFRDTL